MPPSVLAALMTATHPERPYHRRPEMHIHSTPNEDSGAEWAKFSVSDFSIAPLSFLAETLLATDEYWETLPDPIPLFLREALAELLEAVA
jgi:hypothetical protein